MSTLQVLYFALSGVQ